MLITDKKELLTFKEENRIWQGIPGIEVTKKGRIFSALFNVYLSFLNLRNQSSAYSSSLSDAMPAAADSIVTGVEMIRSSPGCQPAGVELWVWSDFCRARIMRLIS